MPGPRWDRQQASSAEAGKRDGQPRCESLALPSKRRLNEAPAELAARGRKEARPAACRWDWRRPAGCRAVAARSSEP
jgi:hypothetical protein